jgi:hypothetical protein
MPSWQMPTSQRQIDKPRDADCSYLPSGNSKDLRKAPLVFLEGKIQHELEPSALIEVPQRYSVTIMS